LAKTWASASLGGVSPVPALPADGTFVEDEELEASAELVAGGVEAAC
jgi:hypothetical protein